MQEKIPFEFTELKSSNVPFAVVQRGDVVKIANSDLDSLEAFYRSKYDGMPLKLFSKQFAISILYDGMEEKLSNMVMCFLVRSIREGQFIQVDFYVKSKGDRVFWTEVIDNRSSSKSTDGSWFVKTYSVMTDSTLFVENGNDSKQISSYISQVVTSVIFFMQENINKPKYVTKTTNVHTESSNKPNKKKGKKNTKKTVRQTIYVPKCIIIGTDVQNVEDDSKVIIQNNPDDNAGNTIKDTTEGCEKRIYTGHTESWVARGHKRRIVHKDGTVEYINVKPAVHKRNPDLLAKGMERGRDIKLRTTNLEE